MNITKHPKRTIITLSIIAIILVMALISAGIAYKVHRSNLAKEKTATAYYQNKDYASALDLVNQEIAKQPNSAEQYDFRANIERDKGDTANAEKDYAKSIELNSSYLSPRINWASMEINLGNKDKAKQIISDALKQFPNQATLIALQKSAGIK